MADEDTPEENDVEAEMMRMMQEELSGDDAGGGSDDDSALAEMAAALGDGDGDEGGNIDEMLEQEMLKAMQTDTGEATDAGLGALPAFGGGAAAGPIETPDGIERLADVDVNVTVELGGVSLEVKDIMQWTRDSIVELEAQETDLVEIMVNGKLFARGEVVVVQDTFGVRIVELVDPIIEPSFRDR